MLGNKQHNYLDFDAFYIQHQKTFFGQKSTSISRSAFYFLAVWTGLEPATPCVTGMYSNQLNYQTRALFTVSYTNKILGELHCECKYTTLFDSCKYFLKKRQTFFEHPRQTFVFQPNRLSLFFRKFLQLQPVCILFDIASK